MTLEKTPLEGLFLAKGNAFGDHRGSFERLFCALELQQPLHNRSIVQINQSITSKTGAVRGLHYQKAPHQEMKWVRCLEGKVFDIALDIRPNSPTRFQWFATELSPENHTMMIIPEGFAHGFQVLEGPARLLYLHTAFYTPEAEGGFHLLDPKLKIQLPLPVSEMSERDKQHPWI